MFSTLVRAAELLQRAPDAARFLIEADQAHRQGGMRGLGMYVAGGGWRPGMRAVSPAVQEATEATLPRLAEAYSTFREHLHGGPQEEILDGPAPWADALRHLLALKYGVIVIFGEKGWGKTSLALKLAYSWHERLGWPVEVAGLWEEDRPAFAQPVSMNRVVARMQKVARYLDQEEGEPDDGLTEEDLTPKGKKAIAHRRIFPHEIEALKRRITVIDEAHLFFSGLSAAGQTASRDAAKGLQNQVRHLENLVICICQKQSEMPRALKTSAVQLFKYASEATIRSDYRDGEKRETQRLWKEVLAGLAAIKTGNLIEIKEAWAQDAAIQDAWARCIEAHRYYAEPYQTLKAWNYMLAGDLGGHTYRGPCPNGTLTREQMAEVA